MYRSDYQNWCCEKHAETNHMYDKYLPYEFHLRMVHQVYLDFKHLLDHTVDYYTGEPYRGPAQDQVTLLEACGRAVWGHDLIEDARQSYNDVKDVLGQEAADIVFAVTNETGKTRKERANDKYYQKIRDTKGAIFVKLCDRIANVQYGKLTKSRQVKMYKDELDHFLAQLGFTPMFGYFNAEMSMLYAPMVNYLMNLFVNE